MKHFKTKQNHQLTSISLTWLSSICVGLLGWLGVISCVQIIYIRWLVSSTSSLDSRRPEKWQTPTMNTCD